MARGRNQVEQRGFHRLRRQFQRPHLIPVRTLAAEGFRCLPRPFGQHPGGLAAVGFQRRVVAGQAGDQLPRQIAVGTGGQGEPDIRALPHPVQQAALAEQLQMPRQARLRLAEDFGELHDTERPARRQREQAQTGRFSGGAQTGQEGFHGGVVT